MVKAGKVPLSQLYDIKAQAANDEVSLTEARNNVKLALLDLAQSLELERSGTEFDIVTPATDNAVNTYMSSIIPPDDIYQQAVTFKPQIKEQEYLLESMKKQLTVCRWINFLKLTIFWKCIISVPGKSCLLRGSWKLFALIAKKIIIAC